jgi:mannose-6-phosphate isomerase-like protein (cupin superfamily)
MTAISTFRERIIENPLIKDRVRFVIMSAETNGQYSLFHINLAPGGGNSLHYHKTFSETFIVTEGVLGVAKGSKEMLLNKGEHVTVEPGVLHRFFNPSSTEHLSFNVLLEPGHRGMERSLQVAYGLAADGHCNKKGIPKNIYHMALLVAWSDTNIPGIFSILSPILRFLAGVAKRKGIDRQLIKKYCKY